MLEKNTSVPPEYPVYFDWSAHRIKGVTTDEAFQELCFLWERRASVGVDCNLFNSQDLLHAQQPMWNTEGTE